MKKRIFAVVLSLVFVLSLFNVTVVSAATISQSNAKANINKLVRYIQKYGEKDGSYKALKYNIKLDDGMIYDIKLKYDKSYNQLNFMCSRRIDEVMFQTIFDYEVENFQVPFNRIAVNTFIDNSFDICGGTKEYKASTYHKNKKIFIVR